MYTYPFHLYPYAFACPAELDLVKFREFYVF